jgi:DNA-binding GntR family transcriptional regulator
VPSPTVAPEEFTGDGGGVGRGERISHAYTKLREIIVRGRMAPGTRIIEADVADRLGVSRTPARSALHRLQQEGYVVAIDRSKERRLMVAPLTQDDARELFEIVGQLEGLAARGAAGLSAPQRTALAQRLRKVNADLSSAAKQKRPDPMGLFDLDMSFHRTYVEAGAGARLLALHRATKPQAERYIRIYISSLVDEISTSVGEHEAIVRRIEAGDAVGARQAVDENWENAARRLSKVIAALGERGSW